MNELRVEVEAVEMISCSSIIGVVAFPLSISLMGGTIPSSLRFLSPKLLPLIILCDMIGNAGCSPRTSSRAAAGNSRFVSSVVHPLAHNFLFCRLHRPPFCMKVQ